MIVWSEPLPGNRKPVKDSRYARPAPPACGLDWLAAARLSASKRSWPPVSEVAPVATPVEIAA